jgi:putative membrane protein
MFVLIGIAIFLRILLPGVFGALHGGPFPHGGLGLLGALLVLLIVLWAVSWVVRAVFWAVRGPGDGYRRGWYRDDPAEEIARVRYARGELTREQFEQIRRDLG